jgi:transposase-like protein
MSLLELLRKSGSDGDVDFLKEAMNVLVHSLLEAEVAAQIGAERYKRNTERTNQRNGYRQREWHPRVGTLELNIPKLRKGSYFPSLLEPRKRVEKASLCTGSIHSRCQYTKSR